MYCLVGILYVVFVRHPMRAYERRNRVTSHPGRIGSFNPEMVVGDESGFSFFEARRS